MTKEEQALVDEIKGDIQFFVRQYQMLVDTREIMAKELKELREENRLLKAAAGNGKCYFLKSGPMLPFKWRG